jgi:TolA-binding protein
MRILLVAALMAASVAVPAVAQRAETTEKRLDRIEQQLRAVQRKVFPQGAGQEVTPEVTPAIPAASPMGVPATTPVADLTARLDALEAQLRQLTGQVEENGHRLRLAEEAVAQLRETTTSRLAALEQAETARKDQQAAAPVPVLPEAVPEPRPVRHTAAAAKKKASLTDPEWVSARETPPAPEPAAAGGAEAAYNEGFRLWEQKKYGEAIRKLEAVVRTYPKDRYASWAGNLIGRAYLDDGNPTAAAQALLANYEANSKGERAADSLFFLGQALLQLKKPNDACKAYDELHDVYGASLRPWLKERLPAARAAAHCA